MSYSDFVFRGNSIDGNSIFQIETTVGDHIHNGFNDNYVLEKYYLLMSHNKDLPTLIGSNEDDNLLSATQQYNTQPNDSPQIDRELSVEMIFVL